MASNFIPIETGSSATVSGREYLQLARNLGDAYASLKQCFAAMVQQKNGDGSSDDHFAQVVTVFGFKANPEDGTNTAAHSAKASYDELNSLIGNNGAAIEQFVAKHRQ